MAKKKRGKGKGPQFERDFCRMLSLWWTDQKRDDIFWRTAGSGARATTRMKKKKGTFGQHGDVQAIDPIGQPLIDLATIELKKGYSGATVGDLLDKGPKNKKQLWEEFIEKASKESEDAESVGWFLITKRDARGMVIFMPFYLYQLLAENGADLGRARPWIKIKLPKTYGRAFNGIFGTNFSEFLRTVSRDNVVKALNEPV